MKNRILTLAVLICAIPASAQNLVPNGSFEEYTECPESAGQAEHATGWMKFRWTPDYFNECNANDYCDVPRNAFGYQPAAGGVAYGGLITYQAGDTSFREYLGAQLTSPLVPGVPVHISFRAAPGGWGWYTAQRFRYTTNNIGLLFTTTQWSGTSGVIPNAAALSFPTPLVDTLGWTIVEGTYVPDSAYEYVVLGNFFRSGLTEILEQDESAPYQGAYAFIDEVCVSTATADCLVHSLVSETLRSNMRAFPNPFSSGLSLDLSSLSARAVDVRILDTLGRVICVRSDVSPSVVQVFDSWDWPQGYYMIDLMVRGSSIARIPVLHY